MYRVMNQSEIKDHIKKLRNSVNYLSKINDKGALILAKNDLEYYEALIDGLSTPSPISSIP